MPLEKCRFPKWTRIELTRCDASGIDQLLKLPFTLVRNYLNRLSCRVIIGGTKSLATVRNR